MATFKAGKNCYTSAGVAIAEGADITGQIVYGLIARSSRDGTITANVGIEYDAAGSETAFTVTPIRRPKGAGKFFAFLKENASGITVPLVMTFAKAALAVTSFYSGGIVQLRCNDGDDMVGVKVDTTTTAWASSTSSFTVHFWQENAAVV